MFEQEVSDESFAVFATDATLNGDTIQVIIDSGVEMVDGSGEARYHRHLVHMSKLDAVFAKGDTLTHNSKTYQLQDKVSDDGIIVTISAL